MHFQYSETVHALADLGRVIRSKRKSSQIRIDDAAALCGVSVDLLSRLDNGKSGVATDRVLKVLDGLGLEMRVTAKGRSPATMSTYQLGVYDIVATTLRDT